MTNKKLIDIYIDFEMYSTRHRKIYKENANYFLEKPFIVSLGYNNKSQATFIELLKTKNPNEFKNFILNQIKRLTGNMYLTYNKIRFIAWDHYLENSIFERFLELNDANFINLWEKEEFEFLKPFFEKESYSLDKLTDPVFKGKNFIYLKELINNSKFLLDVKKEEESDGAYCSIGGILLLSFKKQKINQNIDNFNLNAKLLEEEIKKYSKSDIEKMFYLLDNLDFTESRIKLFFENKKLKKHFNKLKSELIFYTKYLDENFTNFHELIIKFNEDFLILKNEIPENEKDANIKKGKWISKKLEEFKILNDKNITIKEYIIIVENEMKKYEKEMEQNLINLKWN